MSQSDALQVFYIYIYREKNSNIMTYNEIIPL